MVMHIRRKAPEYGAFLLMRLTINDKFSPEMLTDTSLLQADNKLYNLGRTFRKSRKWEK